MVGYSKASLRVSLRNRIFNWGSIRKTAVGTNRIIFLLESFDTASRVEQVQKPHSIQALVAEAFHKRILPRAVWLYIKTRDVRFPQPGFNHLSDELRSVVAANAFRCSVLANR
mgnify:FL=1|jgi:hypothetical protein